MEGLSNNFPRIIVTIVISIIFIGVFNYVLGYDQPSRKINDLCSVNAGSNYNISQKVKPIITAKSSILKKGEEFNVKNYVEAKDSYGNDITDQVQMYGEVDMSKKGSYDILFSVRSDGIVARVNATFLVD